MIHLFAFCNVPVMPVRSEPNHKAEQVNQLLFGERLEVLEVLEEKEWARVRCEWDNYEGWCKTSQFTEISRKEFRKNTSLITLHHYSKLIFTNTEMLLPLGCDLYGLKAGQIVLNEQPSKFKGKKVNIKNTVFKAELLINAARQYLNAPYQWGGRTVMGIDCSGLTQMVFKLCGQRLQRDAYKQANEGEVVDFLQHAQAGDLAFFDNTDGKIIHVGILLDTQYIIHASDSNGKVTIDRIDQGGIISTMHKKRTHNLRLVKRFLPN